ncbi:SGNH/GDSL hydrolase family protein [Amycolatopsis japonica]|uniref:SGNH/GDSL hydrolase family protein n=1 Tax=Amycolatopsis japonica TaxID=208439 RepID=UPI00380E3262
MLVTAAAGMIAAGAVPAQAASENYVALGDSYSAGTGAGDYGASGMCVRSANAYPALWAKAHATTSFKFVACAGAKTGDVLDTQLGALTAQTTLVTLSIGGNDVGFAGMMATCATGTEKMCVDRIEQAKASARAELPGKLDKTYAAIKDRAPKARVIVLGYPRIFMSGSAFCPMGQGKRTALNDGADELSKVISERVRAAGLTYEDVRDDFDGHGVCSAKPWMNGLVLRNIVESYHPNKAGQANGYYQALAHALG